MKHPNTNIQAPEKRQTSSSKSLSMAGGFEIWSLEFLWGLELGIWDF
jgi:hypothetical protein